MKATEKADFFRQTAKQINEIEGNTIKMDLVVKHFSNLTVEELFEIYKLRVSVFVVEQNCPYQEIDDADKVAYHVFLKDEAGIQAYVRVLPQGATFPEASIGRVIAKKRRCGLGSQILVAYKLHRRNSMQQNCRSVHSYMPSRFMRLPALCRHLKDT